MTTDHLGSPRVITNENGVVTTRKDYTAFGEVSYTAERTAGLGYSGAEEIRKGYTGYEKDDESGLDFAQARYYNSVHGRFTSVDPLTASASIRNPQTFNRYSYVLNSPYKYVDPMGLSEECRTCSASGMSTQSIDEHRAQEDERRKKEEEERRRRRALRRQQPSQPQPPPPAEVDGRSFVHELMHTSQTDTRPAIADMVDDNSGVDKTIYSWSDADAGVYRFGTGHGIANASSHDGEHVLGSQEGSGVRAIEGLTGTVLTWFNQGFNQSTVYILLEDRETVMVLKDLENLSSAVKKAPNGNKNSKGVPGRFLNANGSPISKVRLKAGVLIGTTSTWTGAKNYGATGLHFGFVHFSKIRSYRNNIAGGANSPANYFIIPCGSASPVRC